MAIHDLGAEGKGPEMDVGFALVLKSGNAMEICPGFEAHIEAVNATDECGIEIGGLAQLPQLER
jgi:hypothetical protein